MVILRFERMVAMKKLLALVLALLCILCCFCAGAENVRSFVWSDESVVSLQGSFVSLDGAGIQFYLPSVFISYPLSQSETASGLIAYCMTDDGEQVIMIRFVPELPEGLAEPEQVLVNGEEGLLATDTATDAVCLLIPTEESRYIQFSFLPVTRNCGNWRIF